MCGFGYGQTFWPPGQNKGEAGKYLCNHLVNLAHGSVVQHARKNFPSRNFKFGMPLIIAAGIPLTDSIADSNAAERMMDIQAQGNWGPLTLGDYPPILKNDIFFGPFLPIYTEAEKTIMRGTMDFVGVNYYSASYIYNSPGKSGDYEGVGTKNGIPLGPTSGTDWQTVYAPGTFLNFLNVGLRVLLNYVSKHFKMDIMITECGVSVPNEPNLTPSEIINDQFRQKFFIDHIKALTDSILIDKVPVKAFISWSLFDNFEWNTYDQRFGLIAISRIGISGSSLVRNVKNSSMVLTNSFVNAVSPFSQVKRGLLVSQAPQSTQAPKASPERKTNRAEIVVMPLLACSMIISLLLLV
jgi:beta-glucosidase